MTTKPSVSMTRELSESIMASALPPIDGGKRSRRRFYSLSASHRRRLDGDEEMCAADAAALCCYLRGGEEKLGPLPVSRRMLAPPSLSPRSPERAAGAPSLRSISRSSPASFRREEAAVMCSNVTAVVKDADPERTIEATEEEESDSGSLEAPTKCSAQGGDSFAAFEDPSQGPDSGPLWQWKFFTK